MSALSVRASVDLGNGHHITSDFPDIHIAAKAISGGREPSTPRQAERRRSRAEGEDDDRDICFQAGKAVTDSLSAGKSAPLHDDKT